MEGQKKRRQIKGLDLINKKLKTYVLLNEKEQAQVRQFVINEVESQMAAFHDKIADFKADLAYLNLILGITGSGKSTLFNYLNGIPLIIEEGQNGMIELDIDPKVLKKDQAFALIGHNFVSKTSIPNFSKPPKENLVYVDFPGQFDNKDILQSIINSCFKYNLAIDARKVKLTLVINYHDLFTNRGTCFQKLLKEIGKFIGCWEKFQSSNSICFVITQCPADSKPTIVEDLLQTLRQIMEQVKDLQRFDMVLRNIVSRKALAVFIAPGKRVTNIEKVMQAGGDLSVAEYQIPKGQIYKPNKEITSIQKIHEVVKKTQFIESDDEMFVQNLQDNAQQVVDSICQNLVQNIKQTIYEAISQKYTVDFQSENLEKEKTDLARKLEKLKKERKNFDIPGLLQLFQINEDSLIKYKALRNDLKEFQKISNIDIEQQISDLVKGIIIILNENFSKMTKQELELQKKHARQYRQQSSKLKLEFESKLEKMEEEAHRLSQKLQLSQAEYREKQEEFDKTVADLKKDYQNKKDQLKQNKPTAIGKLLNGLQQTGQGLFQTIQDTGLSIWKWFTN